MAAAAISIEGLSKRFGRRQALDSVDLQVAKGEMVALIGASGSGKSTLIRHIAGLALADGGRIETFGLETQSKGRASRDLRRLRVRIGVVFQQFNLVGRLSLLTNVLTGRLGRIPAWRGYLFRFTRDEKRQAMRALDRVGLADYAAQRTSTLSGGQQQRAAIARALVQGAEVLLADEPIASLDPEAARRVMEILERINREDGVTVMVSLHQVGFALASCPRTVALKDGRVVYDGPSSALNPEKLIDLYGAEHAVPHLEGPRSYEAPNGLAWQAVAAQA